MNGSARSSTGRTLWSCTVCQVCCGTASHRSGSGARKASSPRAKGADRDGFRYYAQLALEGVPYQKPKHPALEGRVGLDLGPSTIAIVPRQGEARLGLFCAALAPRVATKRRLQRKLDRQRRANNPQNYDEQGRCKKGRKTWHDSQGYQAT